MSFTIGLLCPHGGGSSSGDGGKQQCTCKSIQSRLSIWTAAEYGLVDVVRSSVEQDYSKANACDTYGYTALHYAAQHNKHEVVALLLKRGSNVNANACGATPLHRAAAANAVRACDLLITAGADVNVRDSSFGDQRTPLMKASAQGHESIVEVLLASGKVDEGLRDAEGHTAWDLSAAYPNVRRLLKETSLAWQATQEIQASPQCTGERELNENPKEESSSKLATKATLLPCQQCHQPSLFMKQVGGQLLCRSCAQSLAST